MEHLFEIVLPLTNPVLKFLILLVVMLFVPILLSKIKIPPLLGLIIAGAFLGKHGTNLLERDSSIILSGTAGLLYIMFLAGLEIDLKEFKKNSQKSIVFGLFTFLIPMILGYLSSFYILHFSVLTSILLASMFASHTLLAYPMVSKLGVSKNRAVTVAIGGTLITDTLALLVLAVIVGMTKGNVDATFWIKLVISLIIFGIIVLYIFPLIARSFFKRFEDNVSQYIFVLFIVFLGAFLSELAGIEPIIGAFLSGISLNRLIPSTSPLMNRIEFVGNAIFIPFFLIGVGMLIDYKVFFKDFETIKVGVIMIIVATLSKYLAAYFTQKTYKFTLDERRVIFGLSNAQAAATLAAVLVGYNIEIGKTATGETIRLLNENVLNGTILMILVTCTIASFIAQKGAKNIALAEKEQTHKKERTPNQILKKVALQQERILIPVSNIDTTDELINLSVSIKSSQNKKNLYALSIITDSNLINADEADDANKKASKVLQKASVAASATDTVLNEILRYDINIVNGISSVIKENKITDLILGLHHKGGISDSFLGNLTEGILKTSNTTTFIYKPFQPLSTLKRHVIIIPENAEKEIGFAFWITKLWNLAKNTHTKLVFYAPLSVLSFIERLHKDSSTLNIENIESIFIEFSDWDNFSEFKKKLHKNDNLILVLSRKNKLSYQPQMDTITSHLNKEFKNYNFILIYPMQGEIIHTDNSEVKNTSVLGTFIEPTQTLQTIQALNKIGKKSTKWFRKK